MPASRARILVAEDHEETCEMVVLFLQQAQYEVASSSTIRDTLALARNGTFDLFIFDSLLPDGSGLELCEQVREFDRRTPILFYSGLAQDEDRNRALNSGAQAYLVKPVEISDLLETVRTLISNSSESALESELQLRRPRPGKTLAAARRL